MQRYKLRDLRVLELPDCTSRLALALVAIANGLNREEVRTLLHSYDFRFSNTEFAEWRKVVYQASVLSGGIKTRTKPSPPDKTDENIDELVALRRQGFTREYARQSAGLTFTDTDWTIAGEIITGA